MSQVLYGERSWNPLARTVELTEDRLRRGGGTTPLSELNLGAMAEAFQRGCWLGGGGTERSIERLVEGPGVVPVTRVTGTATPVRVRQAAEFARKLGELAVRQCGGPDQVAALAAQARAEAVSLWIARRSRRGPPGRLPSPWTGAWCAWTHGGRTLPSYGSERSTASTATPPNRPGA
ncbi:hypothetical protein [Streptomyces sp. NPDC048411]|uniref:hypothetical protein n=1 Tax=Streptomyces sp. NPDC048411 TaxID=3157206 RepID=UPI0034532001